MRAHYRELQQSKPEAEFVAVPSGELLRYSVTEICKEIAGFGTERKNLQIAVFCFRS